MGESTAGAWIKRSSNRKGGIRGGKQANFLRCKCLLILIIKKKFLLLEELRVIGRYFFFCGHSCSEN